MKMKSLVGKLFLSLALIAFSSVPAFAAGNLTVTNGTVSNFSSSGDFWNTGMNVMLAITFYSRISDVNVTGLTVNITGTLNASNITGIFVYNDSDSDAVIDPPEVVLGSNTSLNNSINSTFVIFSTVLNVPNHTNRSVLVAFNISRNALRFNTTGAYISGAANVNTSNPEVSDNVTLALGTINSTVKQVLDMRANATLSPRVIDTNVSEQMLVLTVNATGQDKLRKVKILVPAGYSLVDVTDVSIGSEGRNRSFNGATGGGGSSNGVGIVLGTTEFNVSFNTTSELGWVPSTSAIRINFTVNTNVSVQSSAAFTSKVFSNISFIDTDILNEETNVTTAQILQVLSVSANKTAALTNGTDYWEFTFNLNFTTNLTAGLVQFKLNNWTSTAGTINLTNSTVFYATLRNDSTITNNTRMVNITNNYNASQSISFNTTTDVASPISNRVKHFVLRMTIPSGIPAATSWWSVYSILFRSNPS